MKPNKKKWQTVPAASTEPKTAKMSQLKFWNKQNNNKQQQQQQQQEKDIANGTMETTNDAATAGTRNGKRNWLHSPDALISGHVVYLVKFFGNLPVEEPKGIEVIKDVIRKLQFAQQVKKAESGTQDKYKKLEITISINGVAIQEPRTRVILHQFPLHNISYCADEKGVKKFFSFIAKTTKPTAIATATATATATLNGNEMATATTLVNGYGNSSGNNNNNNSNTLLNGSGATTSNAEDKHECFVFISNKLASDITLTIGQAFNLAYRKFISANEKSDLEKAQQQVNNLEKTIAAYRTRLQELSAKLPKSELDAVLLKFGIKDIADVPEDAVNNSLMNGKLIDDKLLIDTTSTTSSTHSGGSTSYLPTVPPRSNGGGGGGGGVLPSQLMHKSNSQKMEELLLNSDSDSDFDPRAEETIDGLGGNGRNITNNLFGFEPPKSFGQQLFSNNNNNNNNNNELLLQNNNNNSNNISNNNNISSSSSINSSNNSSNNFNANMSNGNGNGFSPATQLTTPLLAPPPKASASRRSNNSGSGVGSGVGSGSGAQMNGKMDLFGSDPFEMHATPTIFKSKLSIDDFSLESLDPLRK